MPKRLKHNYQQTEIPETDAVFVFNSNMAGLHREVNSSIASHVYGAETGVYLGVTGNGYAIPFKDRFIHKLLLKDIKRYVMMFKQYATEHPDKKFYICRIEIDLHKSYKLWEIAPMFSGCPRNCLFPQQWKPFLR